MDLPLPLARALDRLLGQPLHAALRDPGLLAQRALRLSHPARRQGAAGRRLMAQLVINDGTVHYEEFGSGRTTVILTPGGMWGGYVHRVVAGELAKDFRVITWDRRNTDGKSDLCIAGELSEADLWADDLAALIRALKLAPCYLGEYAGCRTSPLLCFKYPEL